MLQPLANSKLSVVGHNIYFELAMIEDILFTLSGSPFIYLLFLKKIVSILIFLFKISNSLKTNIPKLIIKN